MEANQYGICLILSWQSQFAVGSGTYCKLQTETANYISLLLFAFWMASSLLCT
jgi:hypothetical protein